MAEGALWLAVMSGFLPWWRVVSLAARWRGAKDFAPPLLSGGVAECALCLAVMSGFVPWRQVVSLAARWCEAEDWAVTTDRVAVPDWRQDEQAQLRWEAALHAEAAEFEDTGSDDSTDTSEYDGF